MFKLICKLYRKIGISPPLPLSEKAYRFWCIEMVSNVFDLLATVFSDKAVLNSLKDDFMEFVNNDTTLFTNMESKKRQADQMAHTLKLLVTCLEFGAAKKWDMNEGFSLTAETEVEARGLIPINQRDKLLPLIATYPPTLVDSVSPYDSSRYRK